MQLFLTHRDATHRGPGVQSGNVLPSDVTMKVILTAPSPTPRRRVKAERVISLLGDGAGWRGKRATPGSTLREGFAYDHDHDPWCPYVGPLTLT